MRDTQDIESVMASFSDHIGHCCRKYLRDNADIQDIQQETFMRYALADNKEFETLTHKKAWCTLVAMNLCKDRLTHPSFSKTLPLLSEDVVERRDSGNESVDPEDIYLLESQQKYQYKSLYEALDTLPNMYREVIELYYFQWKKTNEVAQILNIQQSTVTSRLARARERIKTYISEQDSVVA